MGEFIRRKRCWLGNRTHAVCCETQGNFKVTGICFFTAWITVAVRRAWDNRNVVPTRLGISNPALGGLKTLGDRQIVRGKGLFVPLCFSTVGKREMINTDSPSTIRPLDSMNCWKYKPDQNRQRWLEIQSCQE